MIEKGSSRVIEWSDDIPDIIQTARLEVDKDRPWYVGSVPTLVVVDVDPLQLEVGRPLVLTVGGDPMLLRDNLPELCSYLIATLTNLANIRIIWILYYGGWSLESLEYVKT